MTARLVFEFESLVWVTQWISCGESDVELVAQQLRERLPSITEITIGDVTLLAVTL